MLVATIYIVATHLYVYARTITQQSPPSLSPFVCVTQSCIPHLLAYRVGLPQ